MEPSTEDLRPQVLQSTLQQISSLTNETAECCVICLGNIGEHCEALPCKHRNFDYACLITWLMHGQARCPLCKSEVREIRYDLSEDGKQGKTHKLQEWVEGREEPLPQIEGTLNRSALTFERRRSRSSSSYFEHWDRSLRQSEENALQRRRFVYRHNLYSLHVGSNRRQPAGLRYRELSPQLFRNDPELISRARMWISRELQVFDFLYTCSDSPEQDDGSVRRRKPSKAEYLLEYIIAILKIMDIQGSAGQAEDFIREFLGRKYTRLFLHELRAYLRSPYRWLGAWDRAVQYNTRIYPPLPSQHTHLQSEVTTASGAQD